MPRTFVNIQRIEINVRWCWKARLEVTSYDGQADKATSYVLVMLEIE